MLAYSPAIEAVAGIGTFIFAAFVYFEARRIRRLECIFGQNRAWNDLGNKIAELKGAGRVGDILLGEEKLSKNDLSAEEAFILMSYFNVVSSEYNAYWQGAIDKDYVDHSFEFTCNVLRNNSAWIYEFLKRYGYEERFMADLRKLECRGHDAVQRRQILEESRKLRRKIRKRNSALRPGGDEPVQSGSRASAS